MTDRRTRWSRKRRSCVECSWRLSELGYRETGTRCEHYWWQVNSRAFEIVPGDASSPVILHVPHAATEIPADVRAGIVLDDRALDLELLRSTRRLHRSDRTRRGGLGCSSARCSANRLSRLVVDPEWFPDERERMRSFGRGAVYMRTSGDGPLRRPTEAAERQLIERFFEPYARGVEDLVAERLADTGRVVIIDVHSYPRSPMAYELGPGRLVRSSASAWMPSTVRQRCSRRRAEPLMAALGSPA